MNLDDAPEVLTVDEVAAVMRTGRSATYEAVRRGQLRSVRIGRKIRIPKAALLQLLGIEEMESACEGEGS